MPASHVRPTISLSVRNFSSRSQPATSLRTDKGNEEWTTGLAAAGSIAERRPWHPWFTEAVPNMPAGYATTYNVTGAPHDFSFVTIRLAGHMVPTFQPAAAFSFFSRYMAKQPF